MKKKQVIYTLTKVIGKPTAVRFSTKDGRELFIKGIITEEVELTEKEKTDKIVKELRKAGLPSLAKALKMINK